MKTQEQKSKARLFGAAKFAKLACTGGFEPFPGRLAAPFEAPGTLVHVFCTGCGSMFEAGPEFLAQVAKASGTKLPDSLTGYYFEFNSCTACDGNPEQFKMAMKVIPPQ